MEKSQSSQTEPGSDLCRGGMSMVCYTVLEVGISLLMEGVACSSMRHWKCPCNLLRQPAALQQKHQYFRLMGGLEMRLLLSPTLRETHTHKQGNKQHFFLFLMAHPTALLNMDTGRQKHTNHHRQTLIHFSFTKIPTSLQLVRVQNT